MEEKISVIIPVYNVEKYLNKCIDSIIAQTYKNLEIILVDDGSTDSSLSICTSYKNLDKRIYVIHQDNKGLSGARNTGIEHASGEFLMFIDSDDYILEHMIQTLYTRLKKDNTEMAACSYEYVDEMGNRICEHLSRQCDMKNQTLNRKEMFCKISHKTSGYWYYVISCCKLYKKNIFDSYRFPEGKIHEDEFAIHHIINKISNVSIIEDRLYMYLQRNSSITKNKYTLKRLDAAEAFLDRYYLYKTIKETSLARDALQAAYEVLVEMLFMMKTSEYNKHDLTSMTLSLALKLITNMNLRGIKLLLLYCKV